MGTAIENAAIKSATTYAIAFAGWTHIDEVIANREPNGPAIRVYLHGTNHERCSAMMLTIVRRECVVEV